MMQFDRAKLKAVVLHTCAKCETDRLGAVKLHKVLYFLDMIHYAQSGMPVTGARYIKRPFGPTCFELLGVLREMRQDGEIAINDVEFWGRSKREYVALVGETPGVLNEEETALLDEVIEFVCYQNSAKSISDYSHQLPWELAEFGEEIPYNTALMLFPADVGPGDFEAVSMGASEIAAARLNENTVDMPLLSALRSRLSAHVQRPGV
jgi:hypothetical protein